MALTSWKTFNFFDVTEINLPEQSLFDSSLTSITAGSESLFIGSQDGQVHILSSSFKLVRSFPAYEGISIRHMKQIDGTALLVTIAEDLSSEPRLKVWALDNIDKKTGAPKCLSTTDISNNKKQFPISAFAALDDLSQLAIGFANGAVTVVRGDLIHDRGAKQRTVFESEEPITGVEFREGSSTTVLFVATTGRILTLTISGRGQGQPAKPLEDMGCEVDCMTIDKESREIVVVRDDRIYYYGFNGRGPSYAYEGPKKFVKTFKNYVTVVSAPQATKSSKRFLASDPGMFSTSRFSILDLDLQYVAHTESLTSEVRTAFIEWGDLFLLTRDGKVFRYHEKTLQQKLEIFTQRNLYVLAINFAQKANLDISQRNIILRKYGDYLYKKGDFDTAMQQYLKAIDNTEPSQVIRKYLDTQRIHNLIEYLEELHEHDKATLDHTTLLLNCYAKLKDTKKLEDFITSGYNFDFDTAISMCRQGGYYDQAVFLARKHCEHEIVVDVLIEDSSKYDEALNYIWRLEPEQAYPNLMKYARVLLENCSSDTTQIFIDYYTGQYKPRKDQPIVNTAAAPSGALANFANYIPLPYRQREIASPATVGNNSIDGQVAESVSTEPPLEYKIPKPRTAFSAFVDHSKEFIVFLEACLKQDHVDGPDKTDLNTALFEMYLDMASHAEGSEKVDWETKARKLIDSKQISIDTSNVLLLSHLSSYHDGTILVREREGLRFDIFRSYTSARDTAGAIKALRKYGPDEPALYPAALTYFTSSAKVLEEAGTEVEAVLHKIDTDGLMAPLQVIQTLSTNGVANMGLVKKYLGDTIARERKDIESNRQIALTYRNATAGKREELTNLTTKPTVFQTRRCSACGASLDLPTVHFLCHHSFHQRCLNTPSTRTRSKNLDFDNTENSGDVLDSEPAEPQCPICEKDNETLKAIRKSQLEHANKHDLFMDALARSRDGMGTVGEWFGRGVMDVGQA